MVVSHLINISRRALQCIGKLKQEIIQFSVTGNAMVRRVMSQIDAQNHQNESKNCV